MVKRSLQTAAVAPPWPLVASGAGLIALSYGVVRFGYGLHLPQLRAEFALSPRTAGLIASGSFAAYCLTALAAAVLIPRRGARLVLWTSAGLAAGGSVTVATAGTAGVLAVGVLVAGSAAGAASPALVVAVGSTAPPTAAARAQALVNGGTGVGVAVAGTLVVLAPTLWRPVWAGAALVALLLAGLVDRRTCWPPTPRSRRTGPARHRSAPRRRLTDSGTTGLLPADRWPTDLLAPALGAVLAGAGSAAGWTFGPDLLTVDGGLSGRTTAALWCLLGAAAVLGALSGEAVRVLGLRRAWMSTATLTALATALLALAPSVVPVAALAVALFGAAYTALSGVLIATAVALRPEGGGPTTAVLFLALTVGQALGATVTGTLVGALGGPGAFLAGAATLLAGGALLPTRRAATG